jgi:hypothetical protein
MCFYDKAINAQRRKKNMSLKIPLDEEGSKKFQAVKRYFGFEEDSSVIALLITQAYDRLQKQGTHKLFLSKKTYETAKVHAEQRNQKVSEYINDLISDCAIIEDANDKHAQATV